MARRRFMTPLRWSDMDAYGHVNNVQFLRLLEDARVLAFHGHDPDDGGEVLNTGLIVARHEIDYLQPLHYRPEPVAIDLWISEISGASFEMCYEVLDEAAGHGGEPRVYARAESTMVAYDLEAGRPRRISASDQAQLRAWYDEPVPLRSRIKAARAARLATGTPNATAAAPGVPR